MQENCEIFFFLSSALSVPFFLSFFITNDFILEFNASVSLDELIDYVCDVCTVEWTHLVGLSVAHTFTYPAEAWPLDAGTVVSSQYSREREAVLNGAKLPFLPSNCPEKAYQAFCFFLISYLPQVLQVNLYLKKKKNIVKKQLFGEF